MDILNPPAIVGEQQAGKSKEVKSKLEKLIKTINQSTFDIGELLHEVKKNHYYNEWGYNTFKEYVAELEIKMRKANYLARIVETMEAVNINRNTYEPLGISRLREITSLDVNGTYYNEAKNENEPLKDYIVELVNKGKDMPFEELKQHVKTLKGLTGENELVWLNVCLKKAAKELVVDKAFKLVKLQIGTNKTDDDGEAIEPSDGIALESICADFLSDPNNYTYAEKC